jgi:hypothetical protein
MYSVYTIWQIQQQMHKTEASGLVIQKFSYTYQNTYELRSRELLVPVFFGTKTRKQGTAEAWPYVTGF